MRLKIPALVHTNPFTKTFTAGAGQYSAQGHKFGGNGVWNGSTHMSIPYVAGSALDFGNTDRWSVALFFFIPTGIGGGNHRIIGTRSADGAAQIGWSLFYRETNLDIRRELADGTTDTQVHTGDLPKDTWLSVVATKDNTATREGMEIYIDKVGGATQAGTNLAGSLSNTNDTVIGAETDFGGILPNGIKTAWLTVIGATVNQAWVDKFHDGLIDKSDGNTEIFTIPFTDNLWNFENNLTTGMCRTD